MSANYIQNLEFYSYKNRYHCDCLIELLEMIGKRQEYIMFLTMFSDFI